MTISSLEEVMKNFWGEGATSSPDKENLYPHWNYWSNLPRLTHTLPKKWSPLDEVPKPPPELPITERHSRFYLRALLPPVPTPEALGMRHKPEPPFIPDKDLNKSSLAKEVLNAYEAARSKCLGTDLLPTKYSDISKHPRYKRLVVAGEVLQTYAIPPASWIQFVTYMWVRMKLKSAPKLTRTKIKKDMFPYINFAFSDKLLNEYAPIWHDKYALTYQTTSLLIPPSFRKLHITGKFNEIIYQLRRLTLPGTVGKAEEVVKGVIKTQYVRGWEASYHKVIEDSRKMYKRSRRMVLNGEDIWIKSIYAIISIFDSNEVK